MMDITFEMGVSFAVVPDFRNDAAVVKEVTELGLQQVNDEGGQLLVVNATEEVVLLVRPLFGFYHVGSIVGVKWI